MMLRGRVESTKGSPVWCVFISQHRGWDLSTLNTQTKCRIRFVSTICVAAPFLHLISLVCPPKSPHQRVYHGSPSCVRLMLRHVHLRSSPFSSPLLTAYSCSLSCCMVNRSTHGGLPTEGMSSRRPTFTSTSAPGRSSTPPSPSSPDPSTPLQASPFPITGNTWRWGRERIVRMQCRSMIRVPGRSSMSSALPQKTSLISAGPPTML